jgi:small-conductance mechanosensitive channel
VNELQEFFTWVGSHLAIDPGVQGKIISSVVAVFLLWLLWQILLRTVIHRIENLRLRYQWQKGSAYLIFLIMLLVVGPIWFEGVRSVATYLGLLSAGLAIALKDPVTDLVGRLFILWNHSFEVGDRIQIGDYAGDVIDQRVFQFTLMEVGNWVEADQSTGRILHVPNGMVFTSVLANYTKGSDYIWNEVPVLVTFESDWEKAKRLLQDIVQAHAAEISQQAEESFKQATRRYLIQYGSLTPTVYTSVRDSGVMLTIRYLCQPRNRRDSTQILWENILRAFDQHPDIDLAYPTSRIYNNRLEGKTASSAAEIGEKKLDL